jgi:hypothetical protein
MGILHMPLAICGKDILPNRICTASMEERMIRSCTARERRYVRSSVLPAFQGLESLCEQTNPGPLEAILNADEHIKGALMFGRGRFNAGKYLLSTLFCGIFTHIGRRAGGSER